MTKYRSNYINTLTHRHGCEIDINSNGFKQHDIFTNNAMFEPSWIVMSKSNASIWEGLYKCVGATFPGQKRVALGKAPNLLEKHLDGVVHESKEEAGETGLN